MITKKGLSFFLILISTTLVAQEGATSFKLYGFIRNDFFYNSRQNVEALDGSFYQYPKPIEMANGVDKNDVPNSEMISVATRLGLDINGKDILGAKSSAKIECDFGGFGTTYYLIRLRQAYTKLNWTNTELLVGQTWHPLFGNVAPTNPSLNAGAPFQPFNRSPQVKVKQNLGKTLSFTASALYQMQYMSKGPLGSSASYAKNAILPELFVGLENKTTHWVTGIGGDMLTIKPTSTTTITSASAVAYAQYSNNNWTVKAKTFYGENSSNLCMLGGYAASKFNNDSTVATDYTNLNYLTSWFNMVYGTKWQVGLLVGLSQNLGSNKSLAVNKINQIEFYGNGADINSQLQLDKLFRIAPHVSYNLSNLKFGLEYDFTSADYGKLKTDGTISTPSTASNHRIVASAVYLF